MTRKATGLVTSLLAVILLLIVSCAPAAPAETKEVKEEVTGRKEVGTITGGEGMTVTETTETTAPTAPTVPTTPAAPAEGRDMVEVTLTKSDGSTMKKMMERPRYGGRFILTIMTDPFYFDETFGHGSSATANHVTHEVVVGGNFAMGATGTKEAGWVSGEPAWPTYQGRVAESWELSPETATAIFHIRKGVHFALNPESEASRLVNGREVDAYDVVFSWRRLIDSPKSIQNTSGYTNVNIKSIEATDKWTVVIKAVPGELVVVWRYFATYGFIIPPEVVKKYGDMGDWRNSVGTGAHYLADYVKGSNLTFKKNSNYWMMDPYFPENQLPYVDEVKWLIIPDASTKFAALRTGKLDMLHDLTMEQFDQLLRTNPDLNYLTRPSASTANLYMRVDKPELPFQDIRVRHALSMAIDHQALINDYYLGKADILIYPILDIPEWAGVYVPFDELPRSTQELFEYHPDKAKQLLAEAGYPDGFKTSILTRQENVDLLSMVAAWFADIGVNMEIKVMEAAALNSLVRSAVGAEAMVAGGLSVYYPYYLATTVRTHSENRQGRVKDPVLEEVRNTFDANYFNEDVLRSTLRDIIPYIAKMKWIITLPGPHEYDVWQPWVMQYGGERAVGRLETNSFSRWLWIDQELKREITGR